MTQQKILYGIEGRNAAEAEPGMWEVDLPTHIGERNWCSFEDACLRQTLAVMSNESAAYRRKQPATDAAIRAVQLPEGYWLDGPDTNGNYRLVDSASNARLILYNSHRDWIDSAEGLELRAKLTRALEGAK